MQKYFIQKREDGTYRVSDKDGQERYCSNENELSQVISEYTKNDESNILDIACSGILNMPSEDAADILAISVSEWERMTKEQQEAYAYDTFKHSPELLDMFLGN